MLLVHHGRPQICHSSAIKFDQHPQQCSAATRWEESGGRGTSLSVTLPYMGQRGQAVSSIALQSCLGVRSECVDSLAVQVLPLH